MDAELFSIRGTYDNIRVWGIEIVRGHERRCWGYFYNLRRMLYSGSRCRPHARRDDEVIGICRSLGIGPLSRTMPFPPELIDRILKSLRYDRQSLTATSLVSKAWTSWSGGQAYIFKTVHLIPEELPYWLKSIPPDANGPTSHTRKLMLEGFPGSPRAVPRNPDFLHLDLALFRGVMSLALVQWNATPLDGALPEPYFGHFGKSSRALSLQFCTLDPATLFDLFSLLPNI